VSAVAATLREHARGIPIVLDPVLVAGGGDPLLDSNAVSTLQTELWPLATVVTPNLPEGAILAGRAPGPHDPRLLAVELAAGGPPVLLKGGHGEGRDLVDILATEQGVVEISQSRLRVGKVHGTGCTLSAAMAARLARGEDLETAVRGAIGYVRRCIEGSRRFGKGQWIMLHSDVG
jgi:hydroxymethylpyrimidine/phosphomethylpyrimidine kinase